MSALLNARDSDAFFLPNVQEDFLEHRAALLARRHVKDVEDGKDTSYDVFQLTMAHADLTYWRGLQDQLKRASRQPYEPAIKALVNLVRDYPLRDNHSLTG
jgi:hypothetical protein